MKTIDQVEKEYETFSSTTTIVNSAEDFEIYADVTMENINNTILSYTKDLKDNKKMQLEAKIRNLFFFIFQHEAEDFYDYDNELIRQIINLSKTNKSYIEKLKEVVQKDNYEEILKLFDFIIDYYDKNYEYLEMQRRSLESRYEGFSFVDNSKSDERDIIDEFFHKKLSCITKPKSMEKKKKIC